MKLHTFHITSFTLAAVVLAITGCYKVEGELLTGAEEMTFKEVVVLIEPPAGTAARDNDFNVASLFTEATVPIDFTARVDVPDDETWETVYAANPAGNIVLIGLFQADLTDTVKLNVRNTARSMVLLHPWAIDLAPGARMEAMDYVVTLPEFGALETAIGQAFAQNAPDPLLATAVLKELYTVQQAIIKKLSVFKNPLLFEVDGSTLTVSNENSSAAFGIALYDQDNKFIEHRLCPRLEKSYLHFDDLLDGTISLPAKKPSVSFTIPSDGQWMVKATDGLMFAGSAENTAAASQNSVNLSADLLGMFTGSVGREFGGNLCVTESAGDYLYKGMAAALRFYSEKTISGQELTVRSLNLLSTRFEEVYALTESCLKEDENRPGFFLRAGAAARVLAFANRLSQAVEMVNVPSLVSDWGRFGKEISFCFRKDQETSKECSPFPFIRVNNLSWLIRNVWVEIPGSFCFNDVENCNRFGRFYTWEAAEQACKRLGPAWRLPTHAEWKSLGQAFGGYKDGDMVEGDPAAAYLALLLGGNSGFNAELVGSDVKYWAADAQGADRARVWVLGGNQFYSAVESKSEFLSCRCVRE